VTLAFLCMLFVRTAHTVPALSPGSIHSTHCGGTCTVRGRHRLVLTNVVSVYATLPRLDNQSRVWLSDFLFFTSLFNFSALIE
jgi:hypothetical protein